MSSPVWPSDRIVHTMHDQQLRIHGGLPGVRDENLLHSALAYPKNLIAYEPDTTIVQLAAAYASRIAKNHAFVDGNKRTAWLTCFVFLRLNHYRVAAPEAEVVIMMNGLADGSVAENAFAAWLSPNCASDQRVGSANAT